MAFGLYLLWLNPLLAVVAFAIYPLALFVLAQLQRRANTKNQKQVDVSRDFSGRIAEAVSGRKSGQIFAVLMPCHLFAAYR